METLRSFWYSHFAVRWGLPSPAFALKFGQLCHLIAGMTPQSVLDIGCDTGLMGLSVAQRFPSVNRSDGFDLSEEAIQQARQTARCLPARVATRFWVGDIDAEVLTEQYDLVLYIDCILHSKTPGRLLQQIPGHLTPGGRLVLYSSLSDQLHVSVPGFVQKHLPTVISPRYSDLMEWLESSGLRVEKTQWVGKRWYRLHKNWDYWLRSYTKLFSYAFLPLGMLSAWADHFVAGPGSGVFIVARAE